MRGMVRVGMAAMLGLAIVEAAVRAAPTDATPPPPPLYMAKCAACHGTALQGGAGPALRGPAIAAQAPGDLYKVIRTAMPLTAPGSLTDAQAKLLADHVAARNRK